LQSGTGNPAWREFFLLTLAEVILVLMALYVPALQVVAILLFPLPVALVVRRHYLVTALWVLLAVSIVAFLMFGHILAVLSFVMEAGVIGIVMGLLFKNSVSPGRSLKILVVLSVVIAISLLLFAFIVDGTNPFDIDRRLFGDINEINQWYRDTGMLSAEEQQMMREQIESLIDLMVVLIPGSLVIWAAIKTSISYFMARRMFSRLGYEVKVMPPFREWQYPWYTVWGIIMGLVFLLVGDEWNLTLVSNIGKNVLYIMLFFFMVAGISVLIYLLTKWKTSNFIKAVIVFFIFLYWPMGIGLLLILGVLDPFLNLRRLET
jgi:uncharacterized protein YybS (DUF2232 family)